MEAGLIYFRRTCSIGVKSKILYKVYHQVKVSLTELETAKYGYFDCTRDILQTHVR